MPNTADKNQQVSSIKTSDSGRDESVSLEAQGSETLSQQTDPESVQRSHFLESDGDTSFESDSQGEFQSELQRQADGTIKTPSTEDRGAVKAPDDTLPGSGPGR